jgi:hypothetical protein
LLQWQAFQNHQQLQKVQEQPCKLDLLCSAFDCRNKLSVVNNIEDRVYKVVPGLSGAADDFEKPAIEAIAAHSVTYHETKD